MRGRIEGNVANGKKTKLCGDMLQTSQQISPYQQIFVAKAKLYVYGMGEVRDETDDDNKEEECKVLEMIKGAYYRVLKEPREELTWEN